MPDYPATMEPKSPKAWGPFIMTGEGVGRLFSSSMLDGPFPEHYEPVESPVENALHPKQSESPVVFLYDKQGGRENRFGTAKDYPYIATSYRLTEHEHYVTQHVPALVGLQPSPFVEIPEEVAKEKGIKNGDKVRVTSKRGKLEVLAVVTKRLGGLEVGGKKVYHIGIPIHWGSSESRRIAIRPRAPNWLANALRPSWAMPTRGRPSSRRSWSTSRRFDGAARRRSARSGGAARRLGRVSAPSSASRSPLRLSRPAARGAGACVSPGAGRTSRAGNLARYVADHVIPDIADATVASAPPPLAAAVPAVCARPTRQDSSPDGWPESRRSRWTSIWPVRPRARCWRRWDRQRGRPAARWPRKTDARAAAACLRSHISRSLERLWSAVPGCFCAAAAARADLPAHDLCGLRGDHQAADLRRR